MTIPKSLRKLDTLLRLQQLELERARVERAAIDAAVEKQRKKVADARTELERVLDLARGSVTATTGVAAETLRIAHDYAKWQGRVLAEEESALKNAEALAEAARAQVTRRFERLSALERLRERRAREAALDLSRREQKSLDDQALLRVRPPEPGTVSMKEMPTWP